MRPLKTRSTPHKRFIVFEEHYLDKQRHNRKDFSCGVQELDDYLKRFAFQQSRKGVAAVRVITDNNDPAAILGFYSLSAAQIDVDELDLSDQKRLPRYPVPCFRLGRLAVDQNHQRQGIGRLLIGCAVARCREARRHVAAYALVVDAKDPIARSFYEHYGFRPLKSDILKLYLPLGKHE